MEVVPGEEKLSHSNFTIADLPDEVLREIFTFFTPQQLCTLIAQVCTKWHQISRDPFLWRNLTLKQSSAITAIKLFRDCPLAQLRVLKVNMWDGAGDALIIIVASLCPELKVFSYKGAPIKIHSTSLLALAISCPNITEFLCQRGSVSDEKFGCFARFTKLRVLEFTFELADKGYAANSPLNDADFSRCDFTRLKSVSAVTKVNVRDSNAACIDRFVRKHESVLTMLDTGGSILQEQTYLAMARCAQLQSLICTSADNLNNSAVVMIAKNLKQLKCLWLGKRWSWEPAGITAILSDRNCLTELSQLRFERYIFRDADVIAIADRFSRQLKVLEFSLSYKITDRGIARVLAKCTALEELYIDGLTQLSEALLLTVPNRLPSLRILSITGCTISNESVAELRTALTVIKAY